MRRLSATHSPWYVPRALGDRGTSALRSRLAGASAKAVVVVAIGLAPSTLAACGSGPSQDASEPSGDYPVNVYKAGFPNRQRLAQTTDLTIGVENTGNQEIPEIAVTMFIAGEDGKPAASGQPFSSRIHQAGVADPARPVWVLENKFPIIKGYGVPTGSSPGTVAQTDTFGFGSLAPNDRIEMVWRLTAVEAGTFTIDYQVSAGLYGNAKAVTAGGGSPDGKFVVTISGKPPQARVDAQGNIIVSGAGKGGGASQGSPAAPEPSK